MGPAQTGENVSLDLGGNAAHNMVDNINIELAATDAVSSAFSNVGQACICANNV